MADVNWALGLQGSDPGQAFANAFHAGQQQKQQEAQRQALAALAMNPNDPNAQAAAAQFDPNAVMGVKQHQAELSAEEHQQWVKAIGHAAAMADSPEKWDLIVDQFVASGHPDAAQFKGKFSPALRSYFMAQAGIDPPQPHNPQLVPFTPGGGVAAYNPQTHQIETLVAPNTGGYQAGTPVNAPPVLTDDQMRQMMNGGQPGPTSAGGF